MNTGGNISGKSVPEDYTKLYCIIIILIVTIEFDVEF